MTALGQRPQQRRRRARHGGRRRPGLPLGLRSSGLPTHGGLTNDGTSCNEKHNLQPWQWLRFGKRGQRAAAQGQHVMP